ncbi:hypothetical protein GCM10027416_27600 [Okibacterium endophyticum]
MSSSQQPVSAAANRRIRRFSTVSWVLGTVVMVIVAFTTFTQVGWDEDRGGLVALGGGGGGDAYPWDAQDPVVAERGDNGTWTGEGDSVIRIDQEPGENVPLLVRLESGGEDDVVDVYMTETGDIDVDLPPDDRPWPRNVGYLAEGEESIVIPPEGTLELWVQADAPWELSLEPAELQTVDGTVGGEGNAYLIYEGDALSARFVHKGDGIFFVSIYTDTDDDRPIIESGRVDRRISWDETSVVIFAIESDEEDGAWSVTIDEIATDDPDDETNQTDQPDSATPEDPQTESGATSGEGND